MPFTIMIDETQRVALRDVIAVAGVDRDRAPLEFWVAMLDILPANEKADPDTVHGFCL